MSRTTDTDAVTPARFACRRTGQTFLVGEQMARTARSSVSAVESDSMPSAFELAFKRYEPDAVQDEPHLESRIRAMISHPPDYRDAETGHVSCAWPEDLAVVDGRFAGYVMPRVDTADAVTLHDLHYGDGAGSSPQLGWADRVLVAADLARVVALLHDADIVVGDLRSQDVLVAPDRRVTLFGCDAMQVTDPESGRTYPCRTERGQLAPPELVVTSDWATRRPRSSDLFSLAVELHLLLLNGDHPFDGEWHGPGRKPSAGLLAQNGLWCHAGDERLQPRVGSTPLNVLPESVQRCFRAAFVDGASHPYDRPSARMWQAELQRLHESLDRCARSPHHGYGNHLNSCPWCTSPEPDESDHHPAPGTSWQPGPPLRAPASRHPEPPPVRPRGSASTQLWTRADDSDRLPAARTPDETEDRGRGDRRPGTGRRGRSGAFRVAAWLVVAALGVAGVSTASALRNSVPRSSAPSVTAATRTASTPPVPPVPPSPPARLGAQARALEQIHTDDAHAAEALADSWVAQLATQPAPTGSDEAALSAIVAGHRALKRRYPNALLLRSADWNYTGSSWITVVNQRFATADDANGWCDAQRLPPRQCFAKKLSHSGGVDGSERYRG